MAWYNNSFGHRMAAMKGMAGSAAHVGRAYKRLLPHFGAQRLNRASAGAMLRAYKYYKPLNWHVKGSLEDVGMTRHELGLGY